MDSSVFWILESLFICGIETFREYLVIKNTEFWCVQIIRLEVNMATMYEDATFERSLGGMVVFKRFLAGNSLSRDGHGISEGRLFYFSFRLESCLTQNLNVSHFS